MIKNTKHQSAFILGKLFSITKSGRCVSVSLNILNTPITMQRGKKPGYALPVKTRYDMTEKIKKYEVLDCPNKQGQDSYLEQIEANKNFVGCH